jgi:hypothetical protein
VDPQSGYRYYTASQLETLQRILFAEFTSAEAAFAEKEGRVNPEPAVNVMLAWLEKIFSRAT